MMKIQYLHFVLLSVIFPLVACSSHKRTPAGLVWEDCIHHVPHDSHIIESGNLNKHLVVQFPNGTIREYPRCGVPRVPNLPLNNEETLTRDSRAIDVEGWQVYTSFDNYNNETFDSFLGYWNVPDEPSAWPFNGTDQHVIYLFTALQSDNWIPSDPVVPPLFDIIQPVLQYGVSSPNGGGAYWAIASWYLTLDESLFYSDLVDVEFGEVIFGNMTRTEGNTWYIGSVALSNNKVTALTVTKPRLVSQPWAYVTLEMYALNSCDQFPKKPVHFNGLKLTTGDKMVTPNWQVFHGENPPLCKEDIAVKHPGQVVIYF